MTDLDKAYFAGIFDGEGTIGFYGRRKGDYQIQIAITNTDFALLTWVQQRVPYGTTRVRLSRRDRPNNLPQWEWTVSSRPAVVEFLTALRPYLQIKGRQADVLLSLLDAESKTPRQRSSPTVRARRDVAVAELKRLKRDCQLSIH